MKYKWTIVNKKLCSTKRLNSFIKEYSKKFTPFCNSFFFKCVWRSYNCLTIGSGNITIPSQIAL